MLQDGQSRKLVAAESTDMDFEVDFTELESFGEATLSPKKKTNQDAAKKTEAVGKPIAAVAKLPSKASQPPKALGTGTLSSKKEDPASKDAQKAVCQEGDADSSWTDVEDNPANECGDTNMEAQLEEGSIHASTTQQQGKESHEFTTTPAKRTRTASDCSADSEESRLFIDDVPSPRPDGTAAKELHHPAPSRATASAVATSSALSTPRPSAPLSPQASARAKRGVKRPRLEGQCDQLGQILRMQSAMLKPTPSASASSR